MNAVLVCVGAFKVFTCHVRSCKTKHDNGLLETVVNSWSGALLYKSFKMKSSAFIYRRKYCIMCIRVVCARMCLLVIIRITNTYVHV